MAKITAEDILIALVVAVNENHELRSQVISLSQQLEAVAVEPDEDGQGE